jgi:FkbM family methyltransferase
MYLSQSLYDIFRLSYRARKWYLNHLYAHLTPNQAQVMMEDNTLLYINPRYDYVQREIFLYQGQYMYESHVVRWITQNLPKGSTVVDIGSHIGYYLGPICRGVGPSGKAFFVEPLPEHYTLLQKNISANQFTWATSINLAISDQIGETIFYPAKDSGRNSLAQNSITNAEPIMIKAITLDQLSSEKSVETIDLLQIDVEGAEVLVVQGAAKSIKEHRIKAILCEWHPQQLKDEFQTTPMEFLAQINRYGYNAFRLDEKTGKELALNLDFVNTYQHLVFRLA